MSQSGIANLAHTGGGGLIQTILGDTGSITGNVVTIFANQATNNSGASVAFNNTGTVSTLNLTDGFLNTFLGRNSGGTSLGVSAANVGVGYNSLMSLNGAVQNTAAGYFSMANCTSGNYNSCYGNGSGGSITSGLGNVCLGFGANCGSTGSGNIIIGYTIGSNYGGSETNNIIINGGSVAGESNVLRIGIGVPSQPNPYLVSTAIGGIAGKTIANAQIVAINSVTSQLGVVTSIIGTWTDVTGGSQQLAVGNGYITDNAGGVTYTLPTTASIGDQIQIVGKLGIATITPNANQQILIASASGTVGVTGTAVAQVVGCCISLRCTTSGASTVWRADSYVANWTLN